VDLPKVVFSRWTRWADRMTVDGIDAPGVYLLAHFKKPPLGNADPQTREVIYIGETCDQSLKKRWRQFHRCAFEGKEGHSGGKTYWKIFADKGGENLFVAAFPVEELSDEFRPLFIRYVERKAILDYALKWGAVPKCNKR
jgi:hypothetical protein